MANSLDDTKTSRPQEDKRVSSNIQHNAKKKKQHLNNYSAQKANQEHQGGNAPISETVSVSTHDVEVTCDAVREQELSGQSGSEIKVVKIVDDVKSSTVNDISEILIKDSDAEEQISYGAAVNDVVTVSGNSNEKPELVVISNDNLKSENSNSEQEKEDQKIVSIKKDEEEATQRDFEFSSSSQAEQFKPIFVDNEVQTSGSWLSRLFLLAVLGLCCFTVVHFLRNGLIKKDGNQVSEHSDVYAYDIDKEETTGKNDDEKNSVAKEALVEAENKLVQADIEVDATGNGADGDADESVNAVKSGLMKGLRRSNTVLPSESVSSLIAKKSVDSGISPVLITAIALAESSFNTKAVSYSGKRGLMQISPERERLIRKLQGAEGKTGDLFNPEYNLDLGIWYLKHLMNKYDGNMSKALMAYSWDEETLEKVTSGEMKMPRWAGPYYANVQQYYNAIIGDDGQKLVLSLPKVDETAPKKTTSIQVADSVASQPEEKEAWEKAILKIGKHVSPQTKSEIISVIKEQSLLYDMDPAYLSAIIMAESAFDPLSTSDYGKRGLFQMHPKWARIIADTLGVTWQGEDALFEPEYNIEIAVAYLQHLKLLFDDDLEKVAIAFNLTPYRVTRILAGKRKLPQNIELYLNKIKKNCEDYSCKSEISKSYLERLKKAQAK